MTTEEKKTRTSRIKTTRTKDDYKNIDMREQILLRPNMYIGPVKPSTRTSMVFDETKRRILKKEFSTVSEGMERLFLEALSNAADNSILTQLAGQTASAIEVTMTPTRMSIKNGGIPIPIDKNDEGMYIGSMIFGKLLSSSNYNEEESRVSAGQNGLGVKLLNIFSTAFQVTIGNAEQKRHFKQVWKNNMSVVEEPEIEQGYKGESFVKVAWRLDFARFGCDSYPSEAVELFKRFCMDASMTAKVPVVFTYFPSDESQENQREEFNLTNIEHYARFIHGDNESILVHRQFDQINGMNLHKKEFPTLELAIIDTSMNTDEYDSNMNTISFVNSMMTVDGGVHVDAVYTLLCTHLLQFINSNKSQIKLTPGDIRPHLSIVLNCRLENPEFKSQTKTCLSGPKPKVNVPSSIFNTMKKWNLIEVLVQSLKHKMEKLLSKSDGKKTKRIELTKGVDANEAGGKHSLQCTLFIVEGKSATSWPAKWIDLIENGPDFYGIHPVQGKIMNVMNVDEDKLANNSEIIAIKHILGLKEQMDYTKHANQQTLRYGKIVILTDADEDGVHIKGLLLNYFYCRFPSLFSMGAICTLETPICRAIKGRESLAFYSIPEFKKWEKRTPDAHSYKINYYKGLGTSTDEDIKSDYDNPHLLTFVTDDEIDHLMALAFDVNESEKRKKWLAQWKEDLGMNVKVQERCISEFIAFDLVRYGALNLRRSIPSCVDGMKVSQRKILWGSLDKWDYKISDNKCKVVQLASEISAKTNYHHGENSLCMAIVNMAQTFVGSNNLGYFQQLGQFGTRLLGGEDAASSRYIFTKLNWWIPHAIKKIDMGLIPSVREENEEVESESIPSILPFHVINGCNGIATGYSTFVPAHNPVHVLRWLKQKCNGQETETFSPYYRGFKGEIRIKEVESKYADDSDADDDSAEADLLPEEKEEDVNVFDQTESSSAASSSDLSSSTPKKRKGFVSDDLKAFLKENEKPLETAGKRKDKKEKQTKMETVGLFDYDDVAEKVVITELPIGRWTNNYIKFLDRLLREKKISNYRNLSTTSSVCFELTGVKFTPNEKNLYLVRTYSLMNMVLLDHKHVPKRYNNVDEIMEDFYQSRIQVYGKRLSHIVNELESSKKKLTDKAKFIMAVVHGDVTVIKAKKEDVFAFMDKENLPRELLKISSDHFTLEGVQKIEQDIESINEELDVYKKRTPQEEWLLDLDSFETIYDKHDFEAEMGDMKAKKSGSDKKKRGKK